MRKPTRLPDEVQQRLLREARVRLAARTDLPRIHRLLHRHHYLGSLKPAGERLYYVAIDAGGRWLAVLVFSAAAKHLRARDQWIGWTHEQRRRRLSLLTNNSRFLLLPGCAVPNLGSRLLRLTLDRLSADWQAQYGHPILAVETFVDPAQFCGTVYTASGWLELGQTDGWGRVRSDQGMFLLGAYRRLAVSLFMEWRQHQRRPDHVKTSDFQTLLSEEHKTPALRLVLARRPSLKNLS